MINLGFQLKYCKFPLVFGRTIYVVVGFHLKTIIELVVRNLTFNPTVNFNDFNVRFRGKKGPIWPFWII